MKYFYLQWTDKRPSQCYFTDQLPESINYHQLINIKGFTDIFETINVCGYFSEDFKPYHCENPVYKNRSYLLSHLQKSIRKMSCDKSVKTAKHLLDINPNYLLRRIPILMFEDVIPHESLSIIVWLMMATSKGFVLKKEMMEWILGVIYFLSTCKFHDEYKKIDTINTELIKINYGILQDTFLRACLIRVAYGGMKGDMKMINYCIELWVKRFKEGKSINNEKIHSIKISIDKLKRNEWDLSAIDFHCNHRLIPDIKQQYELYSEEYIKILIWKYSSRLNKRIQYTKDNEEYKDWLIIKKYVRWLQSNMLSN